MVCKRCIWVAGAALLCTSVLVAGVATLQSSPDVSTDATRALPVKALSLADTLTGSSNTVPLEEKAVAPNAVAIDAGRTTETGPLNSDAPVLAPSVAPTQAGPNAASTVATASLSLDAAQGTTLTGPPTQSMGLRGLTDCEDGPGPLLYGAPPHLPEDAWTFGVSDTDFPFIRVENFSGGVASLTVVSSTASATPRTTRSRSTRIRSRPRSSRRSSL